MRIRPAPVGHGVRFRHEGEEYPAVAEQVRECSRCTVLGTVSTVEHLMAALYGLGIDNAVVEVEGPELPILDGSAAPFVEGIGSVGIQAQEALAAVHRIEEPVWIPVGESSQLFAFPSEHLIVTAATDFRRAMAGPQLFTFSFVGSSPADFARDLAPARTFCFEDEIASIRALGLGKGGSIENTVVVSQTGTSTPLRFENELVRHKALDLLGDLALVGRRLVAHVMAVRGGHASHVALAAALRSRAPSSQLLAPSS